MGSAGEVIVRPLTEADLPEADRICQVPFEIGRASCRERV